MSEQFAINFGGDHQAMQVTVDFMLPNSLDRVELTFGGRLPAILPTIVADYMNREMANALSAIRREAYNQGYKDARERKLPKILFDQTWL